MVDPVPSTIPTGEPQSGHWIEKTLFASRWLMAPFYLGLVIALALLLITFGRELVHLLAKVPNAKESDIILGILTLVDLSLAGNLVVMVIFSGYENFVGKMRHISAEDRPEWMGTIDFSALKMKLLGSIVAISAIHLLKAFMNVSVMTDRDLIALVAIHVVFVVSGVFLALSDKLTSSSH
ncbi:TIGR00645 family protein [Phreatobacter aquaticus]|uniref:UPF0114 protein E8L99_08010 n=1 Tax=Phreatobacter aquaticus TaxID=2570229 RepID=A0A4D7QG81_9HYPH|nr:TIGR00645 family protein [Phreatobacter aquaticus]QCK85711.1 TIGR00645 family protein [Phreatobacter aquaticus]